MPGCPKCGNVDIQVMELLTAWNKVEELEDLLMKMTEKPDPARTGISPVGFAAPLMPVANIPEKPEPCVTVPALTAEEQSWKERYDKIKTAYLHTRLEVSGSFGNWDFQTRKRVLEHEISSELGFII